MSNLKRIFLASLLFMATLCASYQSQAMLLQLGRLGIGGVVSVVWYFRETVGGTNPDLWLDFGNNRYAKNHTPVALSGISTFSRASIGTIVNADDDIEEVSSGEKRFHYPLSERGVLVEESRTTALQDYDAVEWVSEGSGASITPLSQGALGFFSGGEVSSGGAIWHRGVSDNALSFTAGTTYTVQAWYKAGTSGKVEVQYYQDGSNYFAVHGDIGGTLITSTSGCTVENVSEVALKDDIYHLSFQFTFTNNVSGTKTGIGPYSSVVGETVIALGMDVQEGKFPTTLIPSAGSPLTRNNDIFYMDGTDFSSWFGAQGSLIIKYYQPHFDEDHYAQIINFSDGTSSNVFSLYVNKNNGKVGYDVVNGGSYHVNKTSTEDGYGQENVVAIRFFDNNFGISVNGETVLTDTSGTVPTVDRVYFGKAFIGNYLNGIISEIRYYTNAFTDAELEAASTLPFLVNLGFTENTLNVDFSNTDEADSQTSGFDWYESLFFGWEPSTYTITDGVIEMDTVDASYVTVASAGKSSVTADGWVGTAFGGGGYFEFDVWMDINDVVDPANSGLPSLFMMAVQHLFALDDEQWPGQEEGYMHYGEIDVMEWWYNTKEYYNAALVDWYGVYNTTCAPDQYCRTLPTSAERLKYIPAKTNLYGWNKYGVLWVPATDSSKGYIQHYLNRKPIGQKIEWDKFDVNTEPTYQREDWSFGIFDTQQFALIFRTGDNQMMKVRNVQVWQKNADSNIVN